MVEQERRSDGLSRTALSASVRSMYREICGRCPPDTHVPSRVTFEHSFYPTCPEKRSTAVYVPKFPVVLKVQTRTMRKAHIDAAYGAKSFKDMKRLAVHLREYCLLISQDDKCKVPVGEVGNLVAATQHTRSLPQVDGVQASALDHSVNKFNIIPSVTLLVDIPETIEESFHRGKVFITLKDATFEQSHPLRHTAELMHILKEAGKLEDPNMCVLLKYHDGGSDHNDTHAWVIICNIIEFLFTRVDMLVSERCVPGQSWNNLAERIMYILNLSLQVVALERSKCSNEVEALIKNKGSMKQIREVAQHNSNVKSECLQSTMPVKELLADMFLQQDLDR